MSQPPIKEPDQVSRMLEVPAVRVNQSDFRFDTLELQFITLAHRFAERVDTQVPKFRTQHVTVWLFVTRAPLVIAICPGQLSSVSCNVHPHHTQLKFNVLANTTVLQVIVFPVEVDLNVIQPVYVLVIPLTSERLPYIFNAVDPAHVGAPTSGFHHVISAQKASLSMVTV